MITREIRWFFKDPLPVIGSWFDQLPSRQVFSEERSDMYLLPIKRSDLGIKIRAGSLEIKSRPASPQPGRIAPGIEGYFESWIKHGFELNADTAGRRSNTPESPDWLEVSKKRSATLIRVSNDGLHFHTLTGTNPGDVQMEYTTVNVKGALWYTFALEWPAQNELLIPETFFRDCLGGSELKRDQSMGYPEFLLRYCTHNI